MLKLKISGCLNNCNALIVNDETGFYAVGNDGGYGSPNPELNDIDYATLHIQSLTEGVVYDEVIDVTNTIKAASTFPCLLDVILHDFEDGRYCITYTVKTDVGGQISVFQATHKLYVYCNVECCVNSYSIDLPEMLCDICNKEKIIGKLNTMQTLLYSIKAAEMAGNDCSFENNLIRLQRICGNGKDYYVKPCSC